ncbi:hypothetical protein [Cognatishimia sp.]|uniref:hypothetical protein n=1 Tax=Cognatishimia sp. TaxID=2211648 RepID=UPI00351494DE|nr:hypothetical protein [Cognatishimia sp.]
MKITYKQKVAKEIVLNELDKLIEIFPTLGESVFSLPSLKATKEEDKDSIRSIVADMLIILSNKIEATPKKELLSLT